MNYVIENLKCAVRLKFKALRIISECYSVSLYCILFFLGRDYYTGKLNLVSVVAKLFDLILLHLFYLIYCLINPNSSNSD